MITETLIKLYCLKYFKLPPMHINLLDTPVQ